jgi:hypothetical protein
MAFDGSQLPYTVAKIVVGGERVVYEAWHKGQSTTCIGTHDTPDAARNACVQHWERLQ